MGSRDERGAALLIVLVAHVGLTVLAAAGMVLTETDLRVSENAEASTYAFYASDAGLQEFLGTKSDGTATESYSYSGGYTTVSGRQLLDLGDGRVLYQVRAEATYTPPGGGVANRTVSAVALFSDGSVTVPASFTSATGLLKQGGAGTISGKDWATPGNPKCPNSPKPDIAGVAVPPNGYTQNGGQLVPDGDPPVADSASAQELLEGTGIDWDGIVNTGLVAPDYSIPPDSWPNFSTMDPDDWPVIFVDGNQTVTPGNSGRGTLIVRGNLTMNGSFQWDGAILVGGYITSNGYQIVEGATVSGLNLLLGETVPTSDLGNGNKVFKYNSCNLFLASKAAFGGLAQVPGTWSERM
jgi:Tfp pilus assembly protein PilX